MCCGPSARPRPGGDPQVDRKPGRAAAAAPGSPASLCSGPVLWGAAAAAAILLAGGGYLAFTAEPAHDHYRHGPRSTSPTEQLEQALTERRKADTFAAEKRKLEEEARQKAGAEAEAKRQAEARARAGAAGPAEGRRGAGRVEGPPSRHSAGRDSVERAPGGSSARARSRGSRAAQGRGGCRSALCRPRKTHRKQVEADAEAKRQADEALTKAEAERQQRRTGSARQGRGRAGRVAAVLARSPAQGCGPRRRACARLKTSGNKGRGRAPEGGRQRPKPRSGRRRSRPESAAPRPARPRTAAACADVPGLRHPRHRRHLRATLARDDRGLAEGPQPAGGPDF